MGLDRFVAAAAALLVGLFMAYAFCVAITAMMGEVAIGFGLPRIVGEVGWHYIPALAPAGWASTYVPRADLRILSAVLGTAVIGTLFAMVC